MTLAETYSLICGVKPPYKPADFPENFFPLPQKFITLSVKTGQAGKDYSHFPLVLKMLKEPLEKNGISILQLGPANEPTLPDVIRFAGDIRKTAHAIKNSLLHLSGDTMTSHLAGNFKTPLVELFGTTSEFSAKPHYLGKHIFLSGTDRPSYQADENPRTINNIKPEEVANAVLELLELKDRVSIKTQYIGPSLYESSIDFIPNFRPDYNQLLRGKMWVRMDVTHNTEILNELLHFRQEAIGIRANKPLEISFDKVAFVEYLIEENYDKEEVLKMGESKVQKKFTYCGPPEKINEVRNDLRSPFDFAIIEEKITSNIEVSPESLATSQRPVVSGNNVYISLYHAMIGVPGLKNIKIGKAATQENFKDYLEGLYIFSLNSQ